ncbi:hypothetical protein HDU99_003085 [Rhizoclosmatium hyalinum]|nr:hypothetical protein HDU99_003085 [Rhizoclosmatium hyalinum]
MDIVNRGFGHYTSFWLKHTIKPILKPSKRVKLITILVGTNDNAPPSSHKHVPVQKYEQNLFEIIDTIKLYSFGAKIIIITPPPIPTDVAYSGMRYNTSTAYRDASIQIFKQATTKFNSNDIQLLDLWELMLPNKSYSLPAFDPSAFSEFFNDDKVHFNAKGNQMLFDGVIGTIERAWPEYKAELMQTVLPLDYENAPGVMSGDEAAVDAWLFRNAASSFEF